MSIDAAPHGRVDGLPRGASGLALARSVTEWGGLAIREPNSGVLAALEGARPADLAPAEVVDAIVVAERLIAHVRGLQAGLLADLARPGRAGDVTRLVQVLVDKDGAARDPTTGEIDPELVQAAVTAQARSLAAAEVAAALCIPHRTASCRIDRATELVDELPATLQALRGGRLDEGRARLIADGTRVLASPVRAAVEAAIVPLAQTRVSRRVQELLDRAVIAADPEAALALEQHARAERCVRHRPGRHGIGHVDAALPAEGAAAVFTLLDLLAQATDRAGDTRGIDARRADALVDICTELLTCGHLDLTEGDRPGLDQDDDEFDVGVTDGPSDGDHDGRFGGGVMGGRVRGKLDARAVDGEDGNTSDVAARRSCPSSARGWRGLSRHGRRPHLNVTVALSTLGGLDRLPGHLAGHGAITAELATSIARAAGTLNLIGVRPETGTAAAVSQTIYRPRQQISDQIAATAGTCRFPSCNQPAWRCDTDHRTSFNHADPQAGGLTRLWDCDPECRRHHLLKTHAQWRASRGAGEDEDATIEWISPTGHHYTDRPREFTIPGEEIDAQLAEIFTVARSQLAPSFGPPPSPSRDEGDLQRIDTIRRRIETLRWRQRRERTLSRLATLTARSRQTNEPDGFSHGTGAASIAGDDPLPAGAIAYSATTTSTVGDSRHPVPDSTIAAHRRAVPDLSIGPARRPVPDPDYRARLHIERIARGAAGIPDDDPPPF